MLASSAHAVLHSSASLMQGPAQTTITERVQSAAVAVQRVGSRKRWHQPRWREVFFAHLNERLEQLDVMPPVINPEYDDRLARWASRNRTRHLRHHDRSLLRQCETPACPFPHTVQGLEVLRVPFDETKAGCGVLVECPRHIAWRPTSNGIHAHTRAVLFWHPRHVMRRLHSNSEIGTREPHGLLPSSALEYSSLKR